MSIRRGIVDVRGGSLTSSAKWTMGIVHFILLGAELGGEKAPMHGPFLRGGIVHLFRNHRSSSWNCR